MLKNKRQWILYIAALGLAVVCAACGSRPQAPVQSTAAAESVEKEQDPPLQEPAKNGPSGDEIVVDGKKLTVDEEQSFDVTLEDWGDLRFLSCEPQDGEGQIRFVLEKDGKTVYVFPAPYDDSEFVWKSEGVNFVTFPDLNGDGRKDAIMSMNLAEKKSGASPFPYAIVYRSEGDSFIINREVTDLINKGGYGGTVENVINSYNKYWAKTSSKAEDFSVTVQECVRKDDREKLLGLVRYPITVSVDGNKLTFNNDRELAGRYEDVFNEKFKAAILAADAYEPSGESRGYWLGDKLVTYGIAGDGSFRITGLNSDLKNG